MSLHALYAQATEARDYAHAAYTVALSNSTTTGDTDAAWRALIQANRVRDAIHSMIIDQIVTQS